MKGTEPIGEKQKGKQKGAQGRGAQTHTGKHSLLSASWGRLNQTAVVRHSHEEDTHEERTR